ncbi:MAG: glycosyltransferase family 4 protein [Chloroflexota bacterium]|nr:glycosyltransferase family 4 protein [Chloroflexota bacterium]
MDKTRPIIWMIDSLGPGGAEQLMPTILKNLQQAGFSIRVCALQIRAGNPIASELQRLGLPVDLIPIRNLRQPLNLIHILRYLRLHRPQLLHTQLEFADILGTLAAKLLGIPSVSTVHTLDVFPEKKSAWGRMKLRWFLLGRFCDRVIAVSEKTRLHYLQSGGLPHDKVITLYNGVDISRFKNMDATQTGKLKRELQLPLNSRIIMTVAVLREPKGIQFMIRALPGILEQCPDVHYLIVGDGVHRATLSDLAAGLSIKDHITFAGHRTDIPNLLASCDIFVLPTLKDALPTVLIEALAAEKPIIASDVGGVPEIIESGVNGLLVEPGDPSKLADACLQLLKDNALRSQIVQAGSATLRQRFSIDLQIEQLSRVYEELTSHAT